MRHGIQRSPVNWRICRASRGVALGTLLVLMSASVSAENFCDSVEWADLQHAADDIDGKLDAILTDPGIAPFIEPATFLQPLPVLRPQLQLVPSTPLPTVARELQQTRVQRILHGRRTAIRPRLSPIVELTPSRNLWPPGDLAGSLRKVSAATGTGTQRRNPIVNDPRVRGSRVGQLAASGSHWIPARIDLDTPLSSMDADVVQRLEVTKGPYSVRRGPGFDSLQFELRDAPRFENSELHASSRLDYQSNGQQWNGRQRITAGNPRTGFDMSYGLRTGNNYQAANDNLIPSSYQSQVWYLAAGHDFDDARQLDVHALRVDQNDVEFAGQAFDINALATSAVDLRYQHLAVPFADGLVVEGWFNTTTFDGDASRSGKRRMLPVFDRINFRGNTNVDSLSTGARAESVWQPSEVETWVAGVDVRHIRQEVNERVTYTRVLSFEADSPIPRTGITNPGAFVEYESVAVDDLRLAAGARVDLVRAEVLDDGAELQNLGLRQQGQNGKTLQQLLGRDQLDQTFIPWSVFMETEWDIDDAWTAYFGAGHSERPPSPTELYAAQPFMFLLQNGLNTVRGDPQLNSERLWQIDAAIGFQCDRGSARLRGFHAWVNDYITFENIGTVSQNGEVEQVNLQYVNTNLATLAGFEFDASARLAPMLTFLAAVSFVEGRDHTRNGDFATSPDAVRFSGLPRGTFGGTPLTAEEPLPGILPLEARFTLRLHEESSEKWWIDLTSRTVAAQDRVATSLLESSTNGFTICSLTGGWRPNDSLSIICGIENLTNRLYREHLDFRATGSPGVFQPGLNAYLGTEWHY